MKDFFIAPIAEGKGDVEALPKLLHRFCRDVQPGITLRVNPVVRVKAGSFLNDQEYFQRYLELAARKAKAWPFSSVLILLDCEDDCPKALGPKLLDRARKFRPDVSTLVALARREYETWFLAAAESLRGIGGLPANLEPPSCPEKIRGAKEWLARQMPSGYDEINHQPQFTERFSFDQAEQVPSFSRLRRKIHALFSG
jgi:hypothetical protein